MNWADPLTSVKVASSVEPSKSSTVPLGVPEPELGETVRLIVTGTPKLNWLEVSEIDVVVPGVTDGAEASAENSDVLPEESVAVAEKTNCPLGTLKFDENETWPLPSVVTCIEPRKVLAWPWPLGSATSGDKKSIV